jgi:hypothetical protein
MMAAVSSALLTQMGARALCVLGGLSAVEWRDAVAGLPNAAVGAEVMRWMFVAVKLVGILVGITCWWHWRGLLRSIKAAPDRCSGCLYPTDQDRCPECGVVEGRESRGKSLAALQRLQSNHFADLWIFLAFLILIRIVGAGVFVGVPAISGAPYGAALRRWGDIAGGTTSWIWIEAPFVLFSLVLVALGLKTLRSCRGVAARR